MLPFNDLVKSNSPPLNVGLYLEPSHRFGCSWARFLPLPVAELHAKYEVKRSDIDGDISTFRPLVFLLSKQTWSGLRILDHFSLA